MSALVLAGAAQFAAVGLWAQGVSWPAIVGLTALINMRNVIYGVAIAPWLAGFPRIHRAAMAHILADETFALAVVHFRRIGVADAFGYWMTGLTSLVWIVMSAVGHVAGRVVADPAALGLDAVFPAAMACLVVVLADTPASRVASASGAAMATGLGLFLPTGVPVVVAAILAPALGGVLLRQRP
jgi:predicted branched-subunit amino acid permease